MLGVVEARGGQMDRLPPALSEGGPEQAGQVDPLAGLQEQAQGTAATNVAGALGIWEGTRLHIRRPRGPGDQIRGVRRTPGRVRRGTAWSVLDMPTSRDTASSSECLVGVWAYHVPVLLETIQIFTDL